MFFQGLKQLEMPSLIRRKNENENLTFCHLSQSQSLGLSKYVQKTPSHNRLNCPALSCGCPVPTQITASVIKQFLKRICFAFLLCVLLQFQPALLIRAIVFWAWGCQSPNCRSRTRKARPLLLKSESTWLHCESSAPLFPIVLVEFCVGFDAQITSTLLHRFVWYCSWPQWSPPLHWKISSCTEVRLCGTVGSSVCSQEGISLFTCAPWLQGRWKGPEIPFLVF